jgi:hypothetical protein
MHVPLPPLPPANDDDGYRPGGRSMVDILDSEHRQLTGLAGELTDPKTPLPRRREVAQVLTATISRHLSAEEQYLYPTARVALADGPGIADRELGEDTALRQILRELAGTDVAQPRHAELAREIADRLARHTSTVERQILTELRQVASDAELIRLGNRVEIAEEAAPTRPHPGSPVTPPWNRIVDPAWGVVDKVRDAVTGRRTRLGDLSRRPVD